MPQRQENVEFNGLSERSVIIVSNRGPVTFSQGEDNQLQFERGTGGLVTAFHGLLQHIDATWIACARSESDAEWHEGQIAMGGEDCSLKMIFLSPETEAYEGYYHVIANPLLWFLQHSMWDLPRNPVIDRDTWAAWENGYIQVNQLFAEEIVRQVRASDKLPLVLLQDYHLYLAARFVRDKMGAREKPTTVHFTHIPWPGPEYWRILPPTMRQAILDGLCAADMLGFQTRADGLNFIRTVETFLPTADVDFKRGWIWHRNHLSHIRDFPISIDIEALKEVAGSDDTQAFGSEIDNMVCERQLIVRVDRIEPTKNIIRGFQAYEELLELYPEYQGKVNFLAILVPSRSTISEYADYQDTLMAAAGRVTTKYGNSEWEPIRILVGQNYPRAIAALQRYDVLLVNAIADGMNLVAKEGPVVNRKNGVLVLSETTGASQQLNIGAITISPCDVYATAEALHQALNMAAPEREERANRLRWIIEKDDINSWLWNQMEAINELNL
jgi:trehalose 6-phosphate synthase